MGRTEHGWVSIAFRILAVVAVIYLLLPLAMMFPLSLEGGGVLRFPPQNVSFHWYGDYLTNRDWLASTLLSFKVAFGASVLATFVGTLAAVGLERLPRRSRALFQLVLLSPVFLPTIVVAVAIYGVYASLRLVGTPLGLLLAHAVLTLPFVLLNVSAAMTAAPRSLEDAAMSLGAGPIVTFLQVTVPLIAKGIAAGAVFAFLVSFDEVVIAKFLSGLTAVTLPKRMLDGMFYELSPMLAAVSVLLVIMNAGLAVIGIMLSRARRA